MDTDRALGPLKRVWDDKHVGGRATIGGVNGVFGLGSR